MKTNSLALCLFALAPAALVAQAVSSPGQPVPPSLEPFAREALPGDSDAGRDFTATDRDHPGSAGDFSAGDYLFPRKGKFMGTLVTGIPYPGIAEYACGFTNRFSVGVVAGVLGNSEPGYGLRFRYVLAQPAENFRIHLKAPVFYYPKSKNSEPWFLVLPSVSAEWRLADGTRLWTGAGIIAAACAESVFSLGRIQEDDEEMGLHRGTWNTLHVGFSRPVTRRITFQCEAAAVLNGRHLASRRTWAGGPPVILTTGLSCAF